MVGTCKTEDIGKVGICKLCGGSFIIGRPSDGHTFAYCPGCSRVTNSKNSKTLDKNERQLRLKYYRLFVYPSFHPNLEGALEYTKEWRRDNPERKYIQKKREVDRYNEETGELAKNRYSRWSSDEVKYLKEKSQIKTAREVAFDLGRTYSGVMVRASLEKIPLMTEDKRHGRLVTR